MEEYITLIAQFGFPMAMCLWFMFKTEKVIQDNTKALMKIHEIISKCSGGKK
jgi:hypothetical protein